ncbi:MAG: FHA domain-containing protein [Rhodocyclaceae bacterium]|nr:FHA domain-containing protein [Rhodocyclaceae bacterium]
MPKLILSMDGLVLKEIELTKERLSIGRKPHNDVQIDNLAISGEHAVITTILDDAFLEDQNSTNGTYVNGQPVKKHVLQNNDLIELGKYRLKFIKNSSERTVSPSEFIETAAIKPLTLDANGELIRTHVMDPPVVTPSSSSETQIIDSHRAPGTQEPAAATASMAGARPPAAAPAGSPEVSEGVLQVLNGANAGKELALTKNLTTIGKPGVQVAVITRRPHGYFITHVEGATFPSVNGKTLDAQAHRLNDQDVIQIAGVKMSFFLR